MGKYSKDITYIKISGKMVPVCPVCNGTGGKRVKVKIFCPHDENAYTEEYKICSRCYGKGYLTIPDV